MGVKIVRRFRRRGVRPAACLKASVSHPWTLEGVLSAPTAEPARLHDHAKLRAWRDESGLTRDQVCARLQGQGVSIGYSWLAALEQGTKRPSLELLVTLARFYGHEPAELLLAGAA
jgi:Helix-turn-helix domain